MTEMTENFSEGNRGRDRVGSTADRVAFGGSDAFCEGGQRRHRTAQEAEDGIQRDVQ